MPTMRNEASGSNGMSSYVMMRWDPWTNDECTLAFSPLEQLEFVDIDCRFRPMQRDDDCESDRHFGCRDGQGEKDEHLSGDVVQRLREGDEINVRGVQHQLDRQQNDDDVAS